jgi:hypothetical protein
MISRKFADRDREMPEQIPIPEDTVFVRYSDCELVFYIIEHQDPHANARYDKCGFNAVLFIPEAGLLLKTSRASFVYLQGIGRQFRNLVFEPAFKLRS